MLKNNKMKVGATRPMSAMALNESRLENEILRPFYSRDEKNHHPTNVPSDSLCWYMTRLKRDRQFWEDRYREEAKSRVRTHEIQRNNQQMKEQARMEREKRICAESELAALQTEHENVVKELEAFRDSTESYLVKNIAPAHWRNDILEEQNQNLSFELDTITAERDALLKEREVQKRLVKSMKMSLDGTNMEIMNYMKAEQAKGARMSGRAKRHTLNFQSRQRRNSSVQVEDSLTKIQE